MPSILVATLGSEPQVIPLTLQLLARAGERPLEAVVVHTDARLQPVAGSLAELRAAFAQQAAWPSLRTVEVMVADVLSPESLDAFGSVLFDTLKACLTRDHRIHLLLAGGRKPMALAGMAVAQMLLGPEDRVWHLFSDDALRRSGRMELAAGDDARLVPIPWMRWSLAPPILTDLVQARTLHEASVWQEQQAVQRKRSFWLTELTPAEREVAAAAVRTGATDAELARALHKSPRTIGHQLASVYDKLRLFLAVRPDVRVDRHTLISEFAALLPPEE